jgi:biotin carboxyl carrier protein
MIDPKRLRGTEKGDDDEMGRAEVRTAMPGRVVRILVKVDSEVEKGDPVIVVEAMKMQNELRSPKDGVVREIRAAEGSNVNGGDILVVID